VALAAAEAAGPPAREPPHDVRAVIEKLVLFVSRNGTRFEVRGAGVHFVAALAAA
jgi:hypothetical protein